MNPQLPAIHEIWVYLSGSPLLALVLTLSAYQAGVIIYERLDRNPLANPVAIAVAIVATVITLIDMPYAKYFEGAQFVHFQSSNISWPLENGTRFPLSHFGQGGKTNSAVVTASK